jgi:hypothetical protein
MDQNALVSDAHALISSMDEAGVPPRLAMWVHTPETDTWKLWITPPIALADKRAFYRTVAKVIAANRDSLSGMDASDTEMLPETHPAAEGLKRFIRIPELGSVRFIGNKFNAFYLPDGIILRVNFEPDAQGTAASAAASR